MSANKTASASRERPLRSRETLDDTLNAFGLFARLTATIPLDNAIAMLMLVKWEISDIESRCGSRTRTWLTSMTSQEQADSRGTRSCDACS